MTTRIIKIVRVTSLLGLLVSFSAKQIQLQSELETSTSIETHHTLNKEVNIKAPPKPL